MRKGGKALSAQEAKDVAQQYRAVALEVPIMRVDRTSRGGLWIDAPVTSKTNNKATITALLNGKEIDKAKHMDLRCFLEDVKALYDSGSFLSDYDAIVRSGPEISENILRNFYAPLGSQSESSKAMKQSRKRAVEPRSLLYHAMARSTCGERVIISSKMRASMKKDSTAKPEEHGEKREKKPYMTLTELCLDETTADGDGHELGRVWAIGRTWCTCTDGAGRLCARTKAPLSRRSGCTGTKHDRSQSQRNSTRSSGGSTAKTREKPAPSAHSTKCPSANKLPMPPSTGRAETRAQRRNMMSRTNR